MDDFISKISVDEKVVFVRALAHLLAIDRKIDKRERQCIRELVELYNIPSVAEVLCQPCSEDELVASAKHCIIEHKTALYLIKELLTLAGSDEDLDIKEVEFIQKLAEALAISPEKIMQINQLVLDRKYWLLRYREIMEDDAE